MGGGGLAETCCAELPCRQDTACPALPWRCPSGEEAEGLVLAFLADPLLPPRSCGGPGLCLWAIAPTRPLLTGTEAAVGKTCTLGMRGISEAITDEKKEKQKLLLLHLNLQGFTYTPKEQRGQTCNLLTIAPAIECNI